MPATPTKESPPLNMKLSDLLKTYLNAASPPIMELKSLKVVQPGSVGAVDNCHPKALITLVYSPKSPSHRPSETCIPTPVAINALETEMEVSTAGIFAKGSVSAMQRIQIAFRCAFIVQPPKLIFCSTVSASSPYVYKIVLMEKVCSQVIFLIFSCNAQNSSWLSGRISFRNIVFTMPSVQTRQSVGFQLEYIHIISSP